MGDANSSYSGKFKHSFHLVVNNGYYFNSTKEAKFFAESLKTSETNETLKKGIDLAPYMTNQSFKMPYQSKHGSNRVQKPLNGTFKNHLIGQYSWETFKGHYPEASVESITKKQKLKEKTSDRVVPSSSSSSLDVGLIDSEKTFSDIDIFKDIPSMLSAFGNEGYNWETWWAIACIVKNEGLDLEVFAKWSRLSQKHNENEAIDKFNDTEKRNVRLAYNRHTLLNLLKRKYPNQANTRLRSPADILPGQSTDNEDELTPYEKRYKKLKEKFELVVFKINYSAEFGIETENGYKTLHWLNVKIAFGDILIWKPTFKKNGQEELKEVSFVEEWYKDPTKRNYNAMDMVPPPMVCPATVYNSWKGFKIESLDVSNRVPESCEEILQLVMVLCNNDAEVYEYVLDWLAQMLQSPATKIGIALVFKSKEGAGKGTLILIMRKIMGHDYVGETSNPAQDVFGPHGSAHIGKILLSMDEVGSADTSKVLGRLKNLITCERCIFNPKCIQQVEMNNCCRFIFTTNRSIPISIDGKDDRRYCLIESSNEHCKDSAFWSKFHKNVMDNEMKIHAFYKFLMGRDTSQRDWMKMPETELRKDLIGASQHPMVFWLDRFIREMRTEIGIFSSSELLKAYQFDNTEAKVSNAASFGIIFKDKIPFAECGITKQRTKKSVTYEIEKKLVYNWLSTNGYTAYDTPP
jgi:hypothetical protein